MKEGQNDIFYITGASSDQRDFITLTHGANSNSEHMPYTKNPKCTVTVREADVL